MAIPQVQLMDRVKATALKLLPSQELTWEPAAKGVGGQTLWASRRSLFTLSYEQLADAPKDPEVWAEIQQVVQEACSAFPATA